jgi:hypothetical protein
MNDIISIQLIPEHYVGYDVHPVTITAHAKESFLNYKRSYIESVLFDAVGKIEAMYKEASHEAE